MLQTINSETKSMSDMPRPKTPMLCNVCKSLSTNTMVYECGSGHDFCQGCIKDNKKNTNNGSNDTIHLCKSRHKNMDLASGDHRKSSLKNVFKMTGGYRTEIKYKNVNFKESYSDIDDEDDDVAAIVNSRTSTSQLEETSNSENVKIAQRPITCPIAECGKIIAFDGVSLHFYFDHSKIPRIPINGGNSPELCLEMTQISHESRCFAVFALKTKNKQYRDDPPLFLMGAKYCTKESKLKSVERQKFYSKDSLVLWICKVSETVHHYSITIAREDKRLGHSYIGEAIHIKDNQDVKSIYSKAECLIVSGKAVKNILETQEHLIVFVHILC